MPALDSFRAARWARTLNLILQALLFLTLFGGLNYLARNYAWRYDLTQQRRYSLSAETLSYLQNLQRPIRIIVTLTEDQDNEEIAQIYRDMRGLLREYEYATEDEANGRITVDYLDVYQRRREADQLEIEEANQIVLICGDRRRTVMLGEIYKVENGVKRVAFQGEQAITSAILDVSNPEKKKIYFLTGHGELSPEVVDPVRGLSALGDALRQRNFEVNTINLAHTRKVPTDASLLIAVAPQGRFQPMEQELLRQHLATNAGRLILLLAPGAPHGLEDLLLDWGIVVDDDGGRRTLVALADASSGNPNVDRLFAGAAHRSGAERSARSRSFDRQWAQCHDTRRDFDHRMGRSQPGPAYGTGIQSRHRHPPDSRNGTARSTRRRGRVGTRRGARQPAVQRARGTAHCFRDRRSHCQQPHRDRGQPEHFSRSGKLDGGSRRELQHARARD